MFKNIVIGIIINLALFSCTPEAIIGVTGEVLDCDNCESDPTFNVWEYNVIILDDFTWKQEITKFFNKNFETVILQDEHIIYSEDGYANINKEVGTKLWDNDVGYQNYGQPSRIVTENHIYHNYSDNLYKINIQSGEVELRYRWSDFQEGRLESPMLVHEGLFYGLISISENEGKKLKWAVCPVGQINSNNWTYYENIFGSNQLTTREISNPKMSKNNLGEQLLIYSKNEENNNSLNNYTVVAYNLKHEKIEWEVNKFDSNIDGESVIVDDDRVYFYHAYDLYCLDAATGDIIWSNLYNTTINIDELASIGDYLFVYDFNFNIQIIKKETGEKVLIKTLADFDDNFASGYQNKSIQIYNDQIYYINSRGSLMRVDIQTGDHQRYHLPKTEEEILGPSFYQNGMAISDEGIIYTSDGFHCLAFPVPTE